MRLSESLQTTLAPWRRRGADGWQHAQNWYRQRPPREQRLLAIAGAIIGIALVFLILIDPAWSTMTRAQRELPELRAQAATVADLTAQVRALRRQGSPAAGNAAPSTDELATSLQREGLTAESWSIAHGDTASKRNGDAENSRARRGSIGGDRVGGSSQATQAITLTLHEASAASLFRWLDIAARDWRLSVIDAELTRAMHATGKRLPGRLSGTLTLIPAMQP
ncbi:type II secretion system protein GspM [Bordetella tumulicola]|uniref:type II secretion system protein GspM n=1 Tax=Bordetella tumulicola TaxID=1649133 RepID=UPI0039EFD570